ncbi:MAG: hypothetical protein KAX93_02790 [Flavobacterium sp.]|nr:hypothetical protein [Flavobacterium sp.]MBP8157283.1 hypothetical protein [Flavobacterium sp.]
MKKLIAALTLLLAFTINANAQDKKELTSAEKGKKEALALSEYLGLNETQTADFARLFEQKHRTLEDKTLSQERRAEVARIIEMKISASISDDQMTKLKQNKDLFKELIIN